MLHGCGSRQKREGEGRKKKGEEEKKKDQRRRERKMLTCGGLMRIRAKSEMERAVSEEKKILP